MHPSSSSCLSRKSTILFARGQELCLLIPLPTSYKIPTFPA